MSTAILAYSIASEINERMGLKYSREQEMAADKCASELLRYINIKPTALSSALIKIKKYSILNGNYLALTGEGTHPALDDRIISIGQPAVEYLDTNYDRTISLVNTFNAILEFNNNHLQSCSNLVRRNIKANVATEDDYILMAMITTYMYDNETKNLEALKYLEIAKSISHSSQINIYKLVQPPINRTI